MEQRDYCLDLQLGGYEDWLMPSLSELKSIIKPNTYAPAINPVHFPKTIYTLYWSSSNSHLETSEALGVCFNGGLVASLDCSGLQLCPLCQTSLFRSQREIQSLKKRPKRQHGSHPF